MDADGVDADVDYEARRQEQIRRNQALLSSLTGVAASTSLTREQVAALSEARAQAAQAAKEARARARAHRAQMMALVPRRDMPPRRARADINYREDAVAERATAAASASAAASGTGASAASDESGEEDTTPRVNASLSDFVVADHLPLGRALSNTSAQQVPTLPLSALAPYLGRSIPLLYHSPNAAAMSLLLTGWPSESNAASQRATPTFNRQSGIQRLANHIAVFVNIDEGEDGARLVSYGNQWLDGGRRITWFAQPTQRVHTPIVGVMLAAARAKQAQMDGSAAREQDEYAREVLGASASASASASAAASSSTAASSSASAATPVASSSKRANGSKRKTPPLPEAAVKTEPADGSDVATSVATAASASPSPSLPTALPDPFSLLLFIRHVGGAYVFAGQLAYHAHDTTCTPMKFIFTLAEFDTLIEREDFRVFLPDGGKGSAAKDNSKNDKDQKPQ